MRVRRLKLIFEMVIYVFEEVKKHLKSRLNNRTVVRVANGSAKTELRPTIDENSQKSMLEMTIGAHDRDVAGF